MPDDPIVGGSPPTGTQCAPIDGPYLLATTDSRLTNASTFPGVLLAGAVAPTDTRYLWRDTSVDPPKLKFYDGSIWKAFALEGPAGPAGASPWSLLTGDFTAGVVGATDLTATVLQTGGIAAGAYVMLTDNSGAQAFYRVTASPSLLDPLALVLTRISAQESAAPDYVFAVENGALVTISGLAMVASPATFEPVVTGPDDAPEFVFVDGDIVVV